MKKWILAAAACFAAMSAMASDKLVIAHRGASGYLPEHTLASKWVNYDYDWMHQPGAMKQIARYADGVGPAWYMLLDEQRSTPQQIAVKPMVADIQSTHLQLHPYTVRQETLPKYVQNIDGLY